jgi:glutamate-5-semialdehyde dehydrogenase
MDSEVLEKARSARDASLVLSKISSGVKDKALKEMADAIEREKEHILSENREDMERAEGRLSRPMLDRLALNEKRIREMADGIRDVAELDDPVGKIESMWKRPNGLTIGRKRVPLGVIGMIYEARPNVTADAASLCLKSGNAVILRGGSEAIRSNRAIADVLSRAAVAAGIPKGAIELIETTDRAAVLEMLRMDRYIDVIIPRGGPELIDFVVQNATVPTIETGAGNCHIYVDEGADYDKAIEIIHNAKVQRPAVCNAAEKLLVNGAIAEEFLPLVVKRLREAGVIIRGCEKTMRIVPDAEPAMEEDWDKEYLDLIIGVKVVDSIDDAIEHINRYGTGHSEAIITESYANAMRFLDEVDSSAVYVNASTRFTDGGQFGLGSEIGISTQKLHARGPMGVKELTTTKFIIFGSGQIRE